MRPGVTSFAPSDTSFVGAANPSVPSMPPSSPGRVVYFCSRTGDAWLDGERLYLSYSCAVLLRQFAQSKGLTSLMGDMCDALGLDADDSADRQATRQIVYRLRRALGPGSIRNRFRVGWVLMLRVEEVE